MTARTFDVNEIIRLRRAGWKQKAIADELGCSQGAVSANLGGMPAGGFKTQAALGRLDPAIECVLTESFRKHMGYCPVADGQQEASA